MKTFFSIIVPVLNQKPYISQCLDSILNQSYKNYEIIIVDGQSNDGTIKIISDYKKKYKKKFRLFVNKNLNQSQAINFGIKIAKGKWVTWMNGDDYYFDHNSLSNFYKSIRKTPAKKIHYGNLMLVDENSKRLKLIKYMKTSYLSLLYEGMTLSNHSLVWDISLNHKIGNFINTRVDFDYEWFLRVFKHFPECGKYINDQFGAFRIHKNQKTYRKTKLEIKNQNIIRKTYGFKTKFKFIMLAYLKLRKFYLLTINLEFKYIYSRIFNKN